MPVTVDNNKASGSLSEILSYSFASSLSGLLATPADVKHCRLVFNGTTWSGFAGEFANYGTIQALPKAALAAGVTFQAVGRKWSWDGSNLVEVGTTPQDPVPPSILTPAGMGVSPVPLFQKIGNQVIGPGGLICGMASFGPSINTTTAETDVFPAASGTNLLDFQFSDPNHESDFGLAPVIRGGFLQNRGRIVDMTVDLGFTFNAFNTKWITRLYLKNLATLADILIGSWDLQGSKTTQNFGASTPYVARMNASMHRSNVSSPNTNFNFHGATLFGSGGEGAPGGVMEQSPYATIDWTVDHAVRLSVQCSELNGVAVAGSICYGNNWKMRI